MKFILADREKKALPGTNERFWHLATIHYGIREFIYFVDTLTVKTYIEEITGGHLSAISDDSLWQSLAQYLHDTGLTYQWERK